MKNKLFFLCTVIAVYILAGCSKTIRNNQYGMFGPDDLSLVVQNKQGQNLLDPSTPGHFKEKDFKIIYLTEGVEKLFYEPNLDWARGFYLAKPAYWLKIAYNNRVKPELPSATTYIQWNDQDRDTLVCHFLESENGRKFLEKVFVNGHLMVPESVGTTENGSDRFINRIYIPAAAGVISTIERGYNGAILKIVK